METACACNNKNKVGKLSIALTIFVLLVSMGGSLSLLGLLEHFNGWQAAGYAIVSGIFLAVTVVLIEQVVSSLKSK